MNEILFAALGLERKSSVDDSVVHTVQRELGMVLPPAYVELVRFNEEPMPSAGVFEYTGGETCVSEFLKFTDDPDEEFGILAYAPSRRGGPQHLLPFARDAGDWLLCFDRDASNAVVLLDPFRNEVFAVAPSFEEFIRQLRE